VRPRKRAWRNLPPSFGCRQQAKQGRQQDSA
jgi:hypothetical protein